MSILFLSVAAVFVLRGPIGKALGQWIASWGSPEHKAMEAKWAEVAAASRGVPLGEVADLRADVEELQRQLADVQERLDFAERVLARREERAAALPNAGEHRKPDLDPSDRDEILSQLQAVREEVAELAERLDFAERMLAKPKSG